MTARTKDTLAMFGQVLLIVVSGTWLFWIFCLLQYWLT